jgi:D-sedoheptulose 7-phosphate isomerase
MNLQSLTSNTARFSAIANDLSKEKAFSFLLEMFGLDSSCVVVLYSAGGSSKNIAEAAKVSRQHGAITIGLLGGLMSPLENEFDYLLRTRSDDIQLVEDVHAVFGHLIYKSLSQE